MGSQSNTESNEPFVLNFIRPAEMLLFSQATCDPPLGQSTVVPQGQQDVQFTLLIESSKSFSDQLWDAILWHDGLAEDRWSETAFQEKSEPILPLAVSAESRPKVYRRYYTASLRRPVNKSIIKFTFKYRVNVNGNWRWANEALQTSDGVLHFQPSSVPEELNAYLEGVDTTFAVKPLHSESPGSRLWSLTSHIKAAQGSESTKTRTSLGVPVKYARWFASVRTWSPWLAPRHGKPPFAPHQGALMCSFLRYDGLHFVLLAISGVKDVLAVFDADQHGNVILNARSDLQEDGTVHVLAAASTTFDAASAAVMYQARHVVSEGGSIDAGAQSQIQKMLSDDVKAEWMENWYDGLTYCTWNALGQDLTEEKIFHALEKLKENNINVTNLIIDDNWQSLENVDSERGQSGRGWTDFEANREGFPQGLKHTASYIREKYPNIQHISVWHAILGYWGALHPDGKIAKSYKTRRVNTTGGGQWTVIDPSDVDRMYDDFYRFLLSSGIDSVKTDAQFMLDEIEDAPDRRELIAKTQDAWTVAALRYFSIKTISCMSQFPQCIFHTQLPSNKPRFMVRNSDDFFPDVPSSHPYHIFTNAHNSLFTSYLNILPDWDMFQTYHDYSAFHAAGRCVSGGPIYITDEPGKHDLNLIAQMTAQDVQGKTVVLRPSTMGKSVNVYTAYEEARFLKVGAFCGGKGGTGIVGLFNVSDRALLELVHLSSFPGIEEHQEYIIRGHNTGEISPSISLSSALPMVSVELGVKGSDILSAHPLRTFKLQDGKSAELTVAVLGLLGKMTGAAAVLGTDMEIDEHGRLSIISTVKALGKFGIYVSTLTDLPVLDNCLILMNARPVPSEFVTLDDVQGGQHGVVIGTDLEAAWTAMKLESRYSNEVRVQVVLQ